MHPARAQPEDELALEPRRQQQRRQRRLGWEEGIDQIWMLTQKYLPQARERSERVPAARLADRDTARATPFEQRLERASGIKHEDRYIVPAPRQSRGKHAELTLAAAHGEVAD